MANTYEFECDEKAEVEGMRELRALADDVGVDAFLEMGVKMALPHEERLRREKPDHPMLPLIDQWRRKQERGFE